MTRFIFSAIPSAAIAALAVMSALEAKADCGPAACLSFFDEEFCRAQCLGRAPGQSAGSFGAIALDSSSGSYGYSFEWQSREDAEAVAMRECHAQDKGGADCSVVVWFTHACGALAQAGSKWGAAWADSSRAAAAKALGMCESNGDACQISRAVCSF